MLIGWGVTGVGILISLGWNLFNHFRTGWTAERLRQEQYRLSQWTRLRDRIEQGLDGLVTTSRAIVRQAQEMPDSPESPGLDLLNQVMVDAQDELAIALEEASVSAYCDGDHWRYGANGPSIGTETAWDVALGILAEASAASTKDAKILSLKKLRQPVNEIRVMVQEYCRVQDSLLDPAKL